MIKWNKVEMLHKKRKKKVVQSKEKEEDEIRRVGDKNGQNKIEKNRRK